MNSCPMLCGDSMLGFQKGDLAEQNLWYKATMCYYHTHSWRITATKKALVHVKGTTAIGTRLHSKYQMFLCQQYTSCSPWTHHVLHGSVFGFHLGRIVHKPTSDCYIIKSGCTPVIWTSHLKRNNRLALHGVHPMIAFPKP